MIRDFQEAYHGSAKYFREFSLDHIRSGQDSLKFGHGVYFTSSAKTADNYRANLADGITDAYITFSCTDSDGETVCYEPGDYLYPAASSIHMWGDYDSAMAESEDAGDPEMIELLEQLGEVTVQERYGVVYQVRIPATHRLLGWDVDVLSQSLDLMEMVRDLYGSDKLDALHDQLFMQADEEISEDDFTDAFEQACTRAYDACDDQTREVLGEALDALQAELGDAHIPAHNDFTGGDLYQYLSHSLKGADKTSAYLAKKGIPGCHTTDTFMTDIHQKDPHVFTIWDMSELKILEAVFDASDLIAQEECRMDQDDPSPGW